MIKEESSDSTVETINATLLEGHEVLFVDMDDIRAVGTEFLSTFSHRR
jgi:hypothetical protein